MRSGSGREYDERGELVYEGDFLLAHTSAGAFCTTTLSERWSLKEYLTITNPYMNLQMYTKTCYLSNS